MNTSMNTCPSPPVEELAAKIRAAGIPLDRTGLTAYASGADNAVFAARAVDGHHLIVKTPLRPGPRYATAAWACAALMVRGIPAPRILWHGSWNGGAACVETRCPGLPLTGAPDRLDTTGTTLPEPAVQAARQAGALLRIAHSITVGGYGKLSPAGTGPYRSLATSISPHFTTRLAPDPTGGLADAARRLLTANLWRLYDRGPHLLLGDCAARHIFHDPDTAQVTGFIDLESARGGDPLADLAGFSVREHPDLSRALLDGYFPEGATIDQAWALTLHRARIATHLLLFHLTRGQYQPAEHLADLVVADMNAITSEAPTALPAHPPSPSPSQYPSAGEALP
jgi:aminoglycoside phosphotransferase (APT) family kinase protein